MICKIERTFAALILKKSHTVLFGVVYFVELFLCAGVVAKLHNINVS